VQAGLDVFAERGGQARVEGSGGDAWEEVEPAGAGEVECCGCRVLVSWIYLERRDVGMDWMGQGCGCVLVPTARTKKAME
jgi:hypothetical protein